MKAILVIDEMPKSCCDCHYNQYLEYVGYRYCVADVLDRPSWCPLKPMPHRYVEDKVKIETPRDAEVCTHGIQIGRNMVINELLGETDNE